ncbi:hypothetical protein PIROE2DRAFT_17053 [Piromyces sp. E2]|nr:hypothetical protein PIROE2DRAFT_17053 [Piromyces sp. E2]|eukprot:OUM57835.1 hypothetical protein PIROE2DRAFT_17053 [Piromyces sp. E2]
MPYQYQSTGVDTNVTKVDDLNTEKYFLSMIDNDNDNDDESFNSILWLLLYLPLD